MEDPGKLLNDNMKQSDKILELEAKVATGKFLLNRAIQQRNSTRANQQRNLQQLVTANDLLDWASTEFWFKFFSKKLKAAIRAYLGHD